MGALAAKATRWGLCSFCIYYLECFPFFASFLDNSYLSCKTWLRDHGGSLPSYPHPWASGQGEVSCGLPQVPLGSQRKNCEDEMEDVSHIHLQWCLAYRKPLAHGHCADHSSNPNSQLARATLCRSPFILFQLPSLAWALPSLLGLAHKNPSRTSQESTWGGCYACLVGHLTLLQPLGVKAPLDKAPGSRPFWTPTSSLVWILKTTPRWAGAHGAHISLDTCGMK